MSRDGLTKAELARLVGVSSAAVAQWESGKTEPTHESVSAIASAVGVSLSEFWGDPPKKKKRVRAA